jgi:serine protease inhibitor
LIGLAVIFGNKIVRWAEFRRFQCGLAGGGEPFSARDSLIQSYNAMGFDVFSHLVKLHPGQNVLFSPASLAQSLAMLTEGATGSTQVEMAKTLRLSESNLLNLSLSNAAILADLAPLDQALKVNFANSLWIRQNERIETNYVSQMETFFGAQVLPLDVSSPGASDIINRWVNTNTYGHIPQIISKSLDPNLSMILVNTLYFKGEWINPFDPAKTKNAPFTLLNGETVQCPQMRRLLDAGYCNNPMFEAVQLSFSDGDLPGMFKVILVVFVPKEIS